MTHANPTTIVSPERRCTTEGEGVTLTLNIGSLLVIPLVAVLVVVTIANYRRLKRIERRLTPTRQDARGIRYYPSTEDEQDLIRVRELRSMRTRELDEMTK